MAQCKKKPVEKSTGTNPWLGVTSWEICRILTIVVSPAQHNQLILTLIITIYIHLFCSIHPILKFLIIFNSRSTSCAEGNENQSSWSWNLTNCGTIRQNCCNISRFIRCLWDLLFPPAQGCVICACILVFSHAKYLLPVGLWAIGVQLCVSEGWMPGNKYWRRKIYPSPPSSIFLQWG